MDWREVDNILKGISDIVSSSQKQHAEEINLLNHQHQVVIQELLNQAKAEQQNHAGALKEAREQAKYARWGFYVALFALVVTIGFNVYTTWFSKDSINKKDTAVSVQGTSSTQQINENQLQWNTATNSSSAMQHTSR